MTKATNVQAEFWIGPTTAIADRDAPTAVELNAMDKICPIDGTLQVGGKSIDAEVISTLCDIYETNAPTTVSTDDVTFEAFTEAEPDTLDTLLTLGESQLIAFTRRKIVTPGTWAAGDTVTTLQVYVGGIVPQPMARTASDRYAITLPAQDGAGYNQQTVV